MTLAMDFDAFVLACAQGDASAVSHALPDQNLRGMPDREKAFQPLHHAILNGHAEVVSLLIPYSDVDHMVEVKFNDHRTALMLAVEGKGRSLPIVKTLLNVCNAKQVTGHGQSALHLAVRSGPQNVVEALIPYSDVQGTTQQGWSAMMIAAGDGKMGMVSLLLSGSNLHTVNNDGMTALMFAAQEGYGDIVQALLPGSPLEPTDQKGLNAMALAFKKGNWAIVAALREQERTLLESNVSEPVASRSPRRRL